MKLTLFLLISSYPGFAWTQFDNAASNSNWQALRHSGKLTPRLMTKLQLDGIAAKTSLYRVHIHLNATPFKRHLFKTPKGRAQVKALVSKAQDSLIAEPIGGVFKKVYRYHFLFGFSAEVDLTALNHLVNLDQVASIDEVPRFTNHRRLGTDNQTKTTDTEAFAITQMDKVHAMGFRGAGVTVAIIDDALDRDHPAFEGRILGGFDFGDNDADFGLDSGCDQSHGTGVAGIAVGQSAGVTGVAPDADLVFYKVSTSECDFGDLVAAVDQMVLDKDRFNIKVASLSLGNDIELFQDPDSCEANSPQMLVQAFRNVTQAGIITFASAGNAANCNGIEYPSCYPGVISVASVYDTDIGEDINCYPLQTCVTSPDSQCDGDTPFIGIRENTEADQVTYYGNVGNNLDVLAPAEWAKTAAPGNQIEMKFGGTSAAAPFAAGLAAILLAATNRNLNLDEMRTLLIDHGVPRQDLKTGKSFPRINALASLIALLEGDRFQTVKSLIFPWVSNSAQFESTIVVNNYGSAAGKVRFIARRANVEETETSAEQELPPRSFLKINAAELFPKLGVGPGYTVIMESDIVEVRGRWITRDLVADSPSQGLAIAMEKPSNSLAGEAIMLGYLPAEENLQSAPVIVNIGEDPTPINVYYFDQNGNLVNIDRIAAAEPFHPVIPRFLGLESGNVYAVAHGQGSTLTGAIFVFNAQGQTAIGNVTGINDFQVPQP